MPRIFDNIEKSLLPALTSNRLLLALTADVVIPHVTDSSPIVALVEAQRHG